jgi:hypothetical protein
MRALPAFLQRLLGSDEPDHLTGAVDLSDAAYCFELLTRNLAADCEQFFPQGIDAAPGAHAAAQAS